MKAVPLAIKEAKQQHDASEETQRKRVEALRDNWATVRPQYPGARKPPAYHKKAFLKKTETEIAKSMTISEAT